MPHASPEAGTSIDTHDTFDTFGELLKHLRQRAQMTQDEFGLAVGYSRAHVARLENGQRTPDPSAVRARFVEALHLTEDDPLAARLIELAVAVHAVPDTSPHATLATEPSPEAGPNTRPVINEPLPNNLPLALTSFIGREQELAELIHLLPTTRLLTLIGSGGVGKTRLALELGAAPVGAGQPQEFGQPQGSGQPQGLPLRTFHDGVWLVELAPLSDPSLVARAVADVVGVHEEPGQSLMAALQKALHGRELLLLLDNCEHIVEACAQLADRLLRESPGVRILATSREPLAISGEVTWRVPSLRTPHIDEPEQMAELETYAAVRLFVERARFARPSFGLTEANAPAVRQIVARLDGIPLAIELAAARVRALSVEDIAAHLDDRFRLLVGGNRAALPRHQTLRALVDWSYDLLAGPERVLLRRLAVFAGGWTLEAAEAVCAESEGELGSRGEGEPGSTGDRSPSPPHPLSPSPVLPSDVLDLLTRLVDKSLVMVDTAGAQTRYALLETIRQYSLERLSESDELDQVRGRHLDYFVKLGEAVEIQPYFNQPASSAGFGPAEQVRTVTRLGAERDNVRRALEYAAVSGHIDDGLRLLHAFYQVYANRWGQAEFVDQVQRLLARHGTLKLTAGGTAALIDAGEVYCVQGQLDQAQATLSEAQEILQALDNQLLLAKTYEITGMCAYFRGDYELAYSIRVKWRAIVAAAKLLDEDTIHYNELYDRAVMARIAGNLTQERDWLAQCYELIRGKDQVASTAVARELGYVLLELGECTQAEALFRESLTGNYAFGAMQSVAGCLVAYATLALTREDLARAAQLIGAAEAVCESGHALVMITETGYRQRCVDTLRARLGEAAYDAYYAAGRAMTTDKAVAFALQDK